MMASNEPEYDELVRSCVALVAATLDCDFVGIALLTDDLDRHQLWELLMVMVGMYGCAAAAPVGGRTVLREGLGSWLLMTAATSGGVR